MVFVRILSDRPETSGSLASAALVGSDNNHFPPDRGAGCLVGSAKTGDKTGDTTGWHYTAGRVRALARAQIIFTLQRAVGT